jgi:hypothetical protein
VFRLYSCYASSHVVADGYTATTDCGWQKQHWKLNISFHEYLDQFSRVAKASVNDIIKNLEAPENITTQALEDMQVPHDVTKRTGGSVVER